MEQEVDDFASGLTGQPTTTPAEIVTTEEEPKAEQPKYAQITEAQWNELVAKAARVDDIEATTKKGLDTAFGKIGGFSQQMTEIKASIPAGIGSVSAEDLKSLEDVLPEIMPGLVEGINAALKKGGKPMDTAEIETRFQERLAQSQAAIEHKFEIRLVDMAHPDWREQVNLPEFETWKASKPADYQEKLLGWDGPFVASALTEFKAVVAKAKAAEVAKSKSTRREIIDGAVAPRGTGGHEAKPEEDHFMAGLKAGRNY